MLKKTHFKLFYNKNKQDLTLKKYQNNYFLTFLIKSL